MSKIPKSPEDIFQEFTEDFKNAYGADLVSILLYGSAARGDYIYKKSDINFMVVLSESGISKLNLALPLVRKWKKRNVATPLMITQQYIESSLDSFPIEFLNMSQFYKVIYGDDVFSSLEINSEYLRLQCEREMRGKLLHLREAYLNTNGKMQQLKYLLDYTLSAFTSIFSAILYLKEIEIPASKQQILMKTSDSFELDRDMFKKILNLRTKKIKLNKEEINQLVGQYIEQIRKLTNIVDKL